MSTSFPPWKVGHVVLLKKFHPCGDRRWTVYLLGMDVGLQCQGCRQRIKLSRRQFERVVDRYTPPQY
jgi:hypothetical protein